MEKLCLCQLPLEHHKDDVCSAAGNGSRALFVEEKGCLKEKCCPVLRLRDALMIAGVCASMCVQRGSEEAKSFSSCSSTVVYIHDVSDYYTTHMYSNLQEWAK